MLYLNITCIVLWIILVAVMFLRMAQEEQAEKEALFLKSKLKEHNLKFYYKKGVIMTLEKVDEIS